MTRAEADVHSDPAVRQFLDFLERDIVRGQNLSSLPPALAKSLSQVLRRRVDLAEKIEGEVSL